MWPWWSEWARHRKIDKWGVGRREIRDLGLAGRVILELNLGCKKFLVWGFEGNLERGARLRASMKIKKLGRELQSRQ